MGHSKRSSKPFTVNAWCDPFAEALSDPFLQLKRDRRAESAQAKQRQTREAGVANDRLRRDGIIPDWFIRSRHSRGPVEQPCPTPAPSTASTSGTAKTAEWIPPKVRRRRYQPVPVTTQRPVVRDSVVESKRPSPIDTAPPVSASHNAAPGLSWFRGAIAVVCLVAIAIPAAAWASGRLTESDEQPSSEAASSNVLTDKPASGAVDPSPKASPVLTEKGQSDFGKKPRLVHIKSDPPGASVWIGGSSKSSGETPVFVDLPPGQHSVRFTAAGFQDASSVVSINVESQRVINPPSARMIPEMVQLTIRTEPAGASVSLNDRETFLSPATRPVIPGRKHEIKVSRAGYKSISQSFTMTPGRDSERYFDLQPEQEQATVEPPENAERHKQANQAIGQDARRTSPAFVPRISSGRLPATFRNIVDRVFRTPSSGVSPFDLEALRQTATADPRSEFVSGVCYIQKQDPEQAVKHFKAAVQVARDTNSVWFAPEHMLIRTLLGMGEHQAAWYWTRKLIADTLAARQTLSPTEFAAAMIQNLRYAGAIAAFLDGPHATTLRTKLSMESEVPTLLASIPKEYLADFNAGARKVSSRHAEFLRTQERRLAEWERKVSEGKESGEIPQTTLTRDFEAGQYFGARTDKFSWDAGGKGFASRSHGTTQSRGRRNHVDRSTHSKFYDLPTRPSTREHLAFAQYVPWDIYSERERLVNTLPE